MKVIILAAGQGSRLHPYTFNTPKALIKINGLPLLEWQLRHLLCANIKEFIVVTGFKHSKVEQLFQSFKSQYPEIKYDLIYNSAYATSENIVSCNLALNYYQEDCILINGDVLFDPQLVRQLIAYREQPINVVYTVKDSYDDDDMKIIKQNNCLKQIGKTIPFHLVQGESLGIIGLTASGAKKLYQETSSLLLNSENRHSWYLKAINCLAQKEAIGLVKAASPHWCEIDYPKDLLIATQLTNLWLPVGSVQ
ncbi:NTP transferase domain-containing protein [Legionella pneumophila]|uniref:phosphocholine cytidylyltransferase family protein n=1 Tax=Legionella pneumophila TaxID=446 RepID=UPI0007784D84|nr:phosphocholine cytidylyltransferase family protein [Legionella pneumophila]HAT8606386.1 NTP transferase domain-containing protein [Legionella pneumophila]